VRLIFLGTGTSFGVPQVGCRCRTCTSTDPRDKRTRAAVLIEDNGRRLLIDTPPELRLQLVAAGVTGVDAVLFTHAHADHVHGIDDLRAFSVKQPGGLPVYGPADTMAELARQAKEGEVVVPPDPIAHRVRHKLKEDEKKKGAQVWLLNRAGGEALQLTDIKGGVDDYGWSPDGKFILFGIFGGDGDISALPLTPERAGAALKPIPFLRTPFKKGFAQFSPDGRWVAYDSDESQRREIYVAQFPGAGGRRRISIAGGTHPRWRSDGKEIFYVAPDRRLMAAARSRPQQPVQERQP